MENFGEDMKWGDLGNKAIQIMNIKKMNSGMSISDETMKLIQELNVYRIEIDLENRKLILAGEQAEKAMNEYLELFDKAPSGFVVLSREGNIQKINQLGAVMLGQDQGTLIHTPFDLHLSPDSRGIFELFLKALSEKKVRQTTEVSLSINNRQSGEMEISGVLSENSEEFIITFRDITHLKETEQYLVESKVKAETADRHKSSFLSTMSHEIRAPLNSIIGFSGILLKEIPGSLNEEQKKQLGMIQSSGRHLLTLINDLLDLSKIEAGQFSVNFEYFNLQEVIEDVLQIEWPLAMSKNIEIHLKESSGIGVIRSDKQRIHQVLLNLVNNAIKFTEKGHVDISCTKEHESMKIEIIDTGIGILKENLEKIFDPFIQIENDFTKINQGSGLGLPVTKKLIELLKGSIDVNSEIGKGTTFTIKLPIEVANN